MQSAFDNTQIRLLEPLADLNLTLFYPMFANTFPLSFHYSNALKEKRKDAKDMIVETEWGDFSPVDKVSTLGNGALFFETESRLRKIMSPSGYRLESVPFTEYKPGYIFLDRTPYVCEFERRYISNLETDVNGTTPALDKALGEQLTKGYKDRIFIVSDTPKESEWISKSLHEFFGFESKPVPVTKDKYSSFGSKNGNGQSNNFLRIYYFSAPYCTYMLKHPSSFAAFRLLQQRRENRPKHLKTVTGLVLSECHSNQIDAIRNCLTKYWKNIFEAAQTNPIAFREICHQYNRLVRSRHPELSLRNSYEYAECLRNHHETGEEVVRTAEKHVANEDSLPVSLDQQKQPLHIHIGAGRLGCGLVIPLFAKIHRLVVVQRVSLNSKKRVADNHKFEFSWFDSLVSDLYTTDHAIGEHRHLTLRAKTVGGVEVDETQDISFQVYVLGDRNSEHDALLNALRNESVNLFVFYDETTIDIEKVLSLIDSPEFVSFSLRSADSQKRIVSALNKLKGASNQLNPQSVQENVSQTSVICPTILPFENVTVEELQSLSFQGQVVCPVVVDRVCGDRRKIGDRHIEVESESFSRVVIQVPESYTRLNRAIGTSVRLVHADDQYKFHHRKKRWMINALHYFIVLHTLRLLKEKKVPSGEWLRQYLHLFVRSAVSHVDLPVLLRAEAIRLCISTEPKILGKEMGISEDSKKEELLEQAYMKLVSEGNDALVRLEAVPDLISRVYEPRDVVRKFKEHCSDLSSFVWKYRDEIGRFPAREMPTLDDIYQAVSNIKDLVVYVHGSLDRN